MPHEEISETKGEATTSTANKDENIETKSSASSEQKESDVPETTKDGDGKKTTKKRKKKAGTSKKKKQPSKKKDAEGEDAPPKEKKPKKQAPGSPRRKLETTEKIPKHLQVTSDTRQRKGLLLIFQSLKPFN